MSVSLWAYSPEKCDGKPCCGDCDKCEKADEGNEDEEIFTIEKLKKAWDRLTMPDGITFVQALNKTCPVCNSKTIICQTWIKPTGDKELFFCTTCFEFFPRDRVEGKP